MTTTFAPTNGHRVPLPPLPVLAELPGDYRPPMRLLHQRLWPAVSQLGGFCLFLPLGEHERPDVCWSCAVEAMPIPDVLARVHERRPVPAGLLWILDAVLGPCPTRDGWVERRHALMPVPPRAPVPVSWHGQAVATNPVELRTASSCPHPLKQVGEMDGGKKLGLLRLMRCERCTEIIAVDVDGKAVGTLPAIGGKEA